MRHFPLLLRSFISDRDRIQARVPLLFVSTFLAIFISELTGCETSNYAPPVKPTTKNFSQLDRGRRLFAHRCIECHTLPAMWKYSREDWPQIVNDMSHRASLKPEERDALVAYILGVRASER
jgi:mono/diheme cytochrome c family protein